MRLGIDLGGTKIEIIALDDNGVMLLRERVDTPKGDYQSTLVTIAGLVHSTEKRLNQKGSIGIGTPGAISPVSGLLINSNSVCLNNKPFKFDLEKRLNREIRIANDANCFALSEAVDGAAAHADIAFGVILGTGVGGGVVVNQQPLIGKNAIGGEWGHNPLPWATTEELPGNACYCGQHGCIETFLSGTGLEKHYHDTVEGQHLTAKQIVKEANQGDTVCNQLLKQYEDRLARALSHMINIVDPDVVVLGGGMSNVERLYQNIPKLWGKYVFSDTVTTELVPAKYGDSSGVRGAAWLWND